MSEVAETLLLVAGFAGAWLLVAGPMYQAAIELDDQEALRRGIEHARDRVHVPRRVSPWWWLIPPVGFWLQRQRTRRFQRALFEVITPEQVEQWLHLTQKATGWFMVSGGGLLLALRETGELLDALDLAAALFWPLVIALLICSALNTVLRQRHGRRIVEESRTRFRPPASD